MIRYLAVGAWALIIALASTYGGVFLKQRKSDPHAAQAAAKVEVKKVRPITVPVIVAGQLKGYVAADLLYVPAAGEGHGGPAIDPESFIMDEAFRQIYGENKLDFSHIEKIDVDGLVKKIAANVNERLVGAPIKEILIKGMTFVPKEDIPR